MEQYEIDKEQMSALREEVAKLIDDAVRKRKEAQAGLKKGERLYRHPFVSLMEKGYANADAFIAEYDKIQKKKSKLSSSERDMISVMVLAAVKTVIIKTAAKKANEKPAEEPAKKKVTKRKKKSV